MGWSWNKLNPFSDEFDPLTTVVAIGTAGASIPVQAIAEKQIENVAAQKKKTLDLANAQAKSLQDSLDAAIDEMNNKTESKAAQAPYEALRQQRLRRARFASQGSFLGSGGLGDIGGAMTARKTLLGT